MTSWSRVNKEWAEIVAAYEEILNIPRHIIEYVAVHYTLLLIVSGKANDEVASLQNIAVKDVEFDSVEFLGFDGWKETLDINPLFVYNSVNGEYGSFVGTCQLESEMTRDQIEQAFTICKKFKEIEEQINEYYY
jgi:hypothetical protein